MDRTHSLRDDVAAAELAASVVAYALDIRVQAILDASRGSAAVAFARHVAMYLTHVAFELSLARVAVAFGRDRSTAAHACHAMEDRRDDPQFDAWIGALEGMLREAPAPSRLVGAAPR